MTHFTPKASDLKVKPQNDLQKKIKGQTSVTQTATSQSGGPQNNPSMHSTASQKNIRVSYSIQTPAESNIEIAEVQRNFPLQPAVSSKIVKPIPDILYLRKNPHAMVTSPVRSQHEVDAQTEISMLRDEVGMLRRENRSLKFRLDTFMDSTNSELQKMMNEIEDTREESHEKEKQLQELKSWENWQQIQDTKANTTAIKHLEGRFDDLLMKNKAGKKSFSVNESCRTAPLTIINQGTLNYGFAEVQETSEERSEAPKWGGERNSNNKWGSGTPKNQSIKRWKSPSSNQRTAQPRNGPSPAQQWVRG